MKILASGMEWVEDIPGGLNQYFADYIQAMNRYGHQAEGLLSGEGRLHSTPPQFRDVIEAGTKLGTYNRIRSFNRAVRSRTSSFRPDIFNPHFALYASMVTRNMLPEHVPTVTHFHGPWAHESQVEDNGAPWKKAVRYRIKKQIELMTYRRSDSFIVLSDYFRDILCKEFGIPGECITVVPGAVDVERFRPSEDRGALRRELRLSNGERVLFCARRLVRRMGIDNLIRAMAVVTRNVPDVSLYVAGEGPLREELKELIADMGLEAKVRLLGRVSSGDLVRWYQAADLSLVPTVTLEGFGLVTTEALACGTPVLGTPYGGTREILEKLSPELLFRDHRPEAIAEKLIGVLRGDCLIPSREECRRYVLENYTWKRVAERVTDVFEEAIQARKEHVKR